MDIQKRALLCLMGLLSILCQKMVSQNIANATIAAECETYGLGKIVIVINEPELTGTGWRYPFELKCKEVATGYIETTQVSNAI